MRTEHCEMSSVDSDMDCIVLSINSWSFRLTSNSSRFWNPLRASSLSWTRIQPRMFNVVIESDNSPSNRFKGLFDKFKYFSFLSPLNTIDPTKETIWQWLTSNTSSDSLINIVLLSRPRSTKWLYDKFRNLKYLLLLNNSLGFISAMSIMELLLKIRSSRFHKCSKATFSILWMLFMDRLSFLQLVMYDTSSGIKFNDMFEKSRFINWKKKNNKSRCTIYYYYYYYSRNVLNQKE